MRKLIYLGTLCVATLVCASVAAAAAPTKESIDTLLAITRVERTLDGMLASIDGLMKQNMAAAFNGQALTAEQRHRMEVMSEKTRDIFRDTMSWPKMQSIYEQIYGETFSQDEIDGLIAFYRTPTGMAYVDKQPIVLQKSIAAMQPLVAPMMQKMQAAMKQTIEEEKANPH